jgi:hypothetical protein
MRVDPLLGSSCKQTGFHSNESTRNNRGTVGSGVFCGPCCNLELAESQSVKSRLGGWCEMAASLGVSQLKH